MLEADAIRLGEILAEDSDSRRLEVFADVEPVCGEVIAPTAFFFPSQEGAREMDAASRSKGELIEPP